MGRAGMAHTHQLRVVSRWASNCRIRPKIQAFLENRLWQPRAPSNQVSSKLVGNFKARKLTNQMMDLRLSILRLF